MRYQILCALLLIACDGSSGRVRTGSGNGDGGNVGGGGTNDMGGIAQIPDCIPGSPVDKDADQDGDGYSPSAGDCNDCNKTINPGAIQIPNDPVDYACNGMAGAVPSCDVMAMGKNDATSLAQAFEQCDPRFFKSATLVGPSDARARAVTPMFGTIKPQQGTNMALLSTGLAKDKNASGFVEPQVGTGLGCDNTFPNPLPDIPANPLCAAELMGMSCEPSTVNDYTELVLKLKAPSNVNSFTFQFQFFSAEYPDFVCTQFNDEFLVLQESNGEFQTATNISFDSGKNPITVNNGLFSVCTNGSKSYDMNCKSPVTMLAGTGYEDPVSKASSGSLSSICADDGSGPCASIIGGGDSSGGTTVPIGGSTGWLTTTAPVTPGEDVTLHFIIFDEGDHIFDSAVLIDNFVWGTSVVSTPTTGPIS